MEGSPRSLKSLSDRCGASKEAGMRRKWEMGGKREEERKVGVKRKEVGGGIGG